MRNPIPQEKCITNKTIGIKIFSCKLFPILNPPKIMSNKYIDAGITSKELIIKEKIIDRVNATTVNGGAKYL